MLIINRTDQTAKIWVSVLILRCAKPEEMNLCVDMNIKLILMVSNEKYSISRLWLRR